MAQGGRGLARIEGKVVFVEGALPGELVEIEMTRKKKDFGEARTLRVLEPHALRVVPACPVYGRCGGCNLQHASFALQSDLKRQVVEDLFRRVAKVSMPSEWPLHTASPWGYRGRIRLVQGREGWGFRAADSHSVIAIQQCPVLAKPLQDIFADQLPNLPEGTELQVLLDSEGKLGFWHGAMTSAVPQRMNVEGRILWADARVFFQSNVEMMAPLLQAVRAEWDSLPGPRKMAVDLFSGVGVFASLLQDHFAQVVAVEWNEGCLVHARRNLGPNCEFISSSAEKYLVAQVPRGIDFLVVDPPRAGLSPEVRQALQQARPRRMAYVSCDPVTLARDIGEFVRNGWNLRRIEGFDFYPQTDHLEMLAVLECPIAAS